MPEIKKTQGADGGFFDPHTHFTGVLPYRVLGMLTPEGKALLGKTRTVETVQKISSLEIPAITSLIEDFLAHHVVMTEHGPRRIEPPYMDDHSLSGPLYDLETRLMVLLHLSLRWGLAVAETGDFARMQENAGTTVRILIEGSEILEKYLGNGLAALLKNISVNDLISTAATLPPDKKAAEITRLNKLKDLGITKLPLPRPDEPAMVKILDTIAEFDYREKGADAEAQYEQGLPKIIRHLNQNVLTATPQNDYDSAYVARGLITMSASDLLDASARELRRQNITYSEQSVPLWTLTGKWKDAAPGLVKAWETDGTVVRWLPMLVGSFLGWIGGDHEPEEATERTMLRLRSTPPEPGQPRIDQSTGATMNCIARHLVPPYDDWMLRWTEPAALPWPARTRETMLEDMTVWIERLRSALRSEVPYATGFDIASPERTWYTPAGAVHLIRVLRVAFEVAREQRRPLVAHVHVGEGYPAFARQADTLQPSAKRAAQEPLNVIYDTDTGLPAHYLCGENNVEQALRAVRRFRRSLRPDELADFDRYVCVRFGHVTHASVIQAQQMAEHHIWADVNLTSNLATGALAPTLEEYVIRLSPVDRPPNPGILKQAIETVRQEQNARLFKHHALVTLLAAGVPTVLGTDGGGIEHSNLPREYALATAVLETTIARIKRGEFTVLSSAKRELPYTPSDKAAKELIDRLQPDHLYHYQWLHHEWMASWKAMPPVGLGMTPTQTILDADLHGVFFTSLVPPRPRGQ